MCPLHPVYWPLPKGQVVSQKKKTPRYAMLCYAALLLASILSLHSKIPNMWYNYTPS